jgi:fucose 4-O-acetylase-like acetyltransferase
MNKQHNELSMINILRVFGIGLVVLRHAFAPFTNSWNLSTFYDYNLTADFVGKYISTLSMPLFVFISGYTYSYLRNSLGKYKTYSTLLKKKLRRLFFPYLLFAPLYNFFFKDYLNLYEYLIPLWTGSGHLWFLLMIFILFLLFYPLEEFFKRNIVTSLTISLLCYFLVLPVHYLNLDPIAHVFKYFIFFYLGYLFQINKELVLSYIQDKTLIMVIVHIFLFSFYFYLLNISNNIYFQSLVNQILLILGILSVTFAFGIINLISTYTIFKNPAINQLVKVINHNSYYVYLFHQPILILIYSTTFFQRLNIIIAIVSGFIFSFILALFFSHLFMSTKIGQKIIGS